MRRTWFIGTATALLLAGALVGEASAHGVSGKDAVFLQGLQGQAIGPLMYLGAKHMVTGYDHLLFLVGVIFFLYRLKDTLLYVSLFTLGHSTTLLLGVLGGIHANSYLIDAIIGFSVVYKAFENMDGFKVGVEIGQMLALTAVLIVISFWRTRPGFLRHAFTANTVLMTAGFMLVGYQLAGYFQQ